MSSAEYHAFRTVPLSPAEEKAAPSAPWLANPAKYVDLLLAGLGLWLTISLIGLLEIVVPFVRTHENIADFLCQRRSFLCHARHRHERGARSGRDLQVGGVARFAGVRCTDAGRGGASELAGGKRPRGCE